MNELLASPIFNNPDFSILRRVPMVLSPRINTDTKEFIATIIDLETMGLNPHQHEIIELAALSFSFSSADGILAVIDTYNELNDPGKPIPEEVTRVTGIKNEDVQGHLINWGTVEQILKRSHLIICHNSGFDRNFLELQTPKNIGLLIESMAFACTMKDINWKEQGIESSKLDYINWKLGFFYDGHRALNDCWATLNILLQNPGVFDELKTNVRKKEAFISAANAPYDKKDLLKSRGYRWSDGAEHIPKGWWITVSQDELGKEHFWLDEVIYCSSGKASMLPQATISARSRYSFRAERVV